MRAEADNLRDLLRVSTEERANLTRQNAALVVDIRRADQQRKEALSDNVDLEQEMADLRHELQCAKQMIITSAPPPVVLSAREKWERRVLLGALLAIGAYQVIHYFFFSRHS